MLQNSTIKQQQKMKKVKTGQKFENISFFALYTFVLNEQGLFNTRSCQLHQLPIGA